MSSNFLDKYEIHYKPKNLENPALDFYLYMTPPIVKMTTKYNSTTLDDLECVPSGLFYLGFENPVLNYINYLG
jgi:hypothetical protein